MSKVVSEDSVRRTFGRMDEEAGVAWLQEHLSRVTAPLLSEPWILDVDVTVKPLYGHQEGAEVGYNPHKPGRPSHTYHTYFVANLRLVVEVEVQSGKRSASKYSAPGGPDTRHVDPCPGCCSTEIAHRSFEPGRCGGDQRP